MKQAIMTSPGVIQFNNIDLPQAGEGQVLLRIQRIGVCGSDVHVFHGNEVRGMVDAGQRHDDLHGALNSRPTGAFQQRLLFGSEMQLAHAQPFCTRLDDPPG